MSQERVTGAVDIGGTKIAVGVVERSGRILLRAETPTDPERGYAAALDRTAALLKHLLNECVRPLEGIGIASTGPIDSKTGIYGSVGTLPGWQGAPLASDLERAFGVPAGVENDADAAALAEALWGAGKGRRSVLYVTISTGIGAGLVLEGRLYRGVSGSHPEMGHHVIDPSGPQCYCKARGCWESLASGPALEGWVSANGGAPGMSAKTICDLARKGDPLMVRAIERERYYLGLGLANLVTMFSPAVIVLGGGIMKSADLLIPGALEVVREVCTQVPVEKTSIVTAGLGDRSGLLGAACAWLHRSEDREA
jgi:glucokinase